MTEAAHLVRDACTAWNLPELRHPAQVIMSQLVTNAVDHARTNMLITVSRRGHRLHISVRDGDPRLPRFPDTTTKVGGYPADEHGQGLQAVHAHAAAWGAMPTRVGKVVWASIRSRQNTGTTPPDEDQVGDTPLA